MSKSPTAFDLKVSPGCMVYHLRGDENLVDILLPAWRRARTFAIRLYGVETQPTLGKKKIARIVRELQRLPELARIAAKFYSGKRDPREEENLFAVGDTRTPSAEAVLSASESVFWKVGLWQDLALFNGDEVIFECLSHERQGLLFGEPNWLQNVGVVEHHAVKRFNYPIFGRPIAPEVSRSFTAALAAPPGGES